MNEENGSAEHQVKRMEQRAVEESARLRTRAVEGQGRTGSEGRGRLRRRFTRGVLESPVTPLIAGLALLGGIALAIGVGDDRARPGLRLLGRRSRGFVEALGERDLAVQPRLLATLARLAAVGLAGLTWRWVRAVGRDRVV